MAKTNTKVIAELASLVLSTSMEISMPTPIKAKPMKNRTITMRTRLKIGTRSRSNKTIQAMLYIRENNSIGIILPIITM